MTTQLMFLSVPGLRPGDIDPIATPTLFSWANAGVMADLVPTFPCVTSPVQASMLTGTPPAAHGVIANGFFHRDRGEVELWTGRNAVIGGEQTWDALRRRRPASRSAVWHAQNIKDSGADFIVTPAPIHEADGSMKLWCYSKPEGLYQELLGAFGHFPLQHYWGPMANIESTKWILRAAAWLQGKHAPAYHFVYVPHLDYAAQKFGPDSPQAKASVAELDRELGVFAEAVALTAGGRDVVYLVAGEYALTAVSGAVHPNRLLREAGLLSLREEDGREHLDLGGSRAFAMVDHQLAHVFVRDADATVVKRVVEVFRGAPGVEGVYAGADRAKIGMEHARSGEVVLVSGDDRWFSYYWWLDDSKAPAFARTVDIHAKPGYDPVELFFDPKTRSIPLDAGLVRGSHGVPVTAARHRAALVCSVRTALVPSGGTVRDVDVQRITLGLLA